MIEVPIHTQQRYPIAAKKGNAVKETRLLLKGTAALHADGKTPWPADSLIRQFIHPLPPQHGIHAVESNLLTCLPLPAVGIGEGMS